MKVLVTGGAGYIGSFMASALLDKNFDVVIFDSLERGHIEAVDKRAKFIKGDIKNLADLESLFANSEINAVMHFAAYISVEESEKNPDLYYQNNVVGTENLFNCAIKTGVDKIIFSSSAAVYGNPQQVPIPEDHPKNPTSEYGKNKLAVEELLKSIREKNPEVSFVALRYFNAAGAAIDGSRGENHNPETHIIPLAIRAAITGSEFNLYGLDYDTPDGTCVRDYIHVLDLVNAHLLGLDHIKKRNGGYFYNVGTGHGFSNKQVIEMVENVSGTYIKLNKKERRSGDVDQLIADSAKISEDLGFRPQYSELKTIVESAWKFHSTK